MDLRTLIPNVHAVSASFSPAVVTSRKAFDQTVPELDRVLKVCFSMRRIRFTIDSLAKAIVIDAWDAVFEKISDQV